MGEAVLVGVMVFAAVVTLPAHADMIADGIAALGQGFVDVAAETWRILTWPVRRLRR